MLLNGDRRAFLTRRLGRAAIAGFFAVPYVILLMTPAIPVPARIAVAAFSCIAAIAPHTGLLLLAAFYPIAAAIPGLFELTLARPFGETLLLSTVVGWWTGAAVRGEDLPGSGGRWALLLAVIAIGSAAVQLVPVYLRVADIAPWWREVSRLILAEFYSKSPLNLDFIRQAINLSACLALFVACAATVRRNGEQPIIRMAVVGFTAAATINVLRPLIAAVASGDVRGWLEANAALRISVFYADTNAAGSVFAMATLLALGLAAASRHLRWTAAILLLVAALWLTGSRAAIGALFACIAVWSVVQQWRRPARVRLAATLGAVALCVAITYVFWPATRNVTTSRALLVRKEMAAASLRMWKTAPLFGVGLGRYRERSPQFMGDDVRSFYAAENAHNNYLQILATLGMLGLATFIAIVVVAARPLKPRSDALRNSVLWAATAFLLTCLVSHPLIVPDAAVAFWLVLGILAGTRSPVALSWWGATLPTVAVIALVLTLPLRLLAAQREALLEHVYRGFSETWMRDLGEEPYLTLVDSSGTVFIEGNDRFISVPLRSSEGLVSVAVTLDGRPVDDVAVPADRWTYLRFIVPRANDGRRFRALGLEPRPPQGSRARLFVGRARLY